VSFILDALKKSEAERSRRSGPTLIDMRIAPARRKWPLWAILISVVLLTNLVVLAFFLLRGESEAPSAAGAAAITAQAASVTQGLPPTSTAASRVAPAASSVLPEPTLDATIAPSDDRPITVPVAASTAPTNNSPAALAADLALPSAQDLGAGGVNLPALQLSLHVYDAVPANRYVLLNSAKMREGDSSADGLAVERITATGVILSWRGRRFKLESGG
jgi:general secretion pathway protein B